MDNQTKEIMKYQSLVQEDKKIMKSTNISEEFMPIAKSFGMPHSQRELPEVQINNCFPHGSSMVLR